MTNTGGTPAGWYHAPGDPEGTQRYWDGAQWIGDPQAVPQAPAAPQAPPVPPAPAAPQAPQAPLDSDATVAYTPPPAAAAPGAGQPPQYGAPPAAGQQPPAFGGAPAGQPPAYGSPPPGAGAPPGYTAFGGPGAVAPAGNLAEPWQRLVARLIDGFIVGIANFIIGVAVAVALDNILGGIIAGLVGVAISVAYEVFLTTKADATLGKKIFKMRIVNEDGSRVDENVMIKRTLPVIVVGVIGAIPILGLLSIPLGLVILIVSLIGIFSDDRRRSVYDRSGNTIVIVEA